MSRASGRHNHPRTNTDPEAATGEQAQIGASRRTQGVPSPIPGGRPHLSNAPAVRQQVPTPITRPEVYGVNAHGVEPGSHTNRERAAAERGAPEPMVSLDYAQPGDPVAPVPVYLVETGGGGQVLRSSSARSLLLSAAGGEAVLLCGVDPRRVEVLVLNESTSSDIRFGSTKADTETGTVALLPWPGNSYLKLKTQDELWAISADSGTPKISVIQVFEVAG